MEKRSSAGNVEQNGSADTTADQKTNEQGPDESDSGDSAGKSTSGSKESSDEQSPDGPASGDSSNGSTSTGTVKSEDEASPGASRSRSSAKNPAAVSLGRLGGLKGGKARARTLTATERSEAARKAATARWQKKKLTK